MTHHNENNQKNLSSGRVETGKAIRFGVSANLKLLEKFDKVIVEKGYASRSEAIRDLIRDQLVEFAWTE